MDRFRQKPSVLASAFTVMVAIGAAPLPGFERCSSLAGTVESVDIARFRAGGAGDLLGLRFTPGVDFLGIYFKGMNNAHGVTGGDPVDATDQADGHFFGVAESLIIESDVLVDYFSRM